MSPGGARKLGEYVDTARALGPDLGASLRILWKETKNLRVRLGLDRHEPDRVYPLRTVYGTLWFRDNFGDITNLPDLFRGNVYRVGRLEAAGAVLDVGANIGLAAAWIAFHNPDREIWCLEPLPGNAGMIRRNCPSARVVQAAAGSRSGQMTLQADEDQVMASALERDRRTSAVEVDVLSLDELADREGIGDVALMKVDVEGMELEVLEGARSTLERTAAVAMETHGSERHAAAVARLTEAGFRVEAEGRSDSTGLVHARRTGS